MEPHTITVVWSLSGMDNGEQFATEATTTFGAAKTLTSLVDTWAFFEAASHIGTVVKVAQFGYATYIVVETKRAFGNAATAVLVKQDAVSFPLIIDYTVWSHIWLLFSFK